MKLLAYFLTLFLGVFLNTSFAQTLTRIPNPAVSYSAWKGYERPLFVYNDLLYLQYTDGIYVYDEVELKKVPNQPSDFYNWVGLYNGVNYLGFGNKLYSFDGNNFTLIPDQDDFFVLFGGNVINGYLYFGATKNSVPTLYRFDGTSFLEIPNPPNHTKTSFYGFYGFAGSLLDKHYVL
jgi:hypothetical protein